MVFGQLIHNSAIQIFIEDRIYRITDIAINNTKGITSQRTMLAIPFLDMSRITPRQPVSRSDSHSLRSIGITNLHAIRLNGGATIAYRATQILIDISLNRSLSGDTSTTIQHGHAVTTLSSEVSNSKLNILREVSIHDESGRETILRLNLRINHTSIGIQIQIVQSRSTLSRIGISTQGTIRTTKQSNTGSRGDRDSSLTLTSRISISITHDLEIRQSSASILIKTKEWIELYTRQSSIRIHSLVSIIQSLKASIKASNFQLSRARSRIIDNILCKQRDVRISSLRIENYIELLLLNHAIGIIINTKEIILEVIILIRRTVRSDAETQILTINALTLTANSQQLDGSETTFIRSATNSAASIKVINRAKLLIRSLSIEHDGHLTTTLIGSINFILSDKSDVRIRSIFGSNTHAMQGASTGHSSVVGIHQGLAIQRERTNAIFVDEALRTTVNGQDLIIAALRRRKYAKQCSNFATVVSISFANFSIVINLNVLMRIHVLRNNLIRYGHYDIPPY